MKDSISQHMLPVRVRVEYAVNPETQEPERVCFVECANNELLTGNVPFSWANYICASLNRKYVAKQGQARRLTDPIAILRIDGNPIQKNESKIVAEDKHGNFRIMDSLEYVESINRAALLGEEIFMERWCQLPISEPIIVSCIFSITGREQYNMAQCQSWILDLLWKLGIIRVATHTVVKSMNGSKFRKVKENPCTLVVIRKMEGK